MIVDDKQLAFKDVISASVKDMRNSLGQVMYKLEAAVADAEGTKSDFAEAQYDVIRIENVINQLHGLYLLETDSLTVQMQETYLYELVEDVIANMGALLQAKGVSVSVEGDDICWYVDPYLVSCIMQINILNAVRYTKDAIAIKLYSNDEGVTISVVDNGAGYPDSVIEGFQALVAGESIAHITSQNTSWLYCEKIAALHQNQGQCGRTVLKNDEATGGGRIDLCLP